MIWLGLLGGLESSCPRQQLGKLGASANRASQEPGVTGAKLEPVFWDKPKAQRVSREHPGTETELQAGSIGISLVLGPT